MKKLFAAALTALVLSGCGYGGVATAGNQVIITRNDGFLLGALRKVYVCKVTEAGVQSCQAAEAP